MLPFVLAEPWAVEGYEEFTWQGYSERLVISSAQKPTLQPRFGTPKIMDLMRLSSALKVAESQLANTSWTKAEHIISMAQMNMNIDGDALEDEVWFIHTSTKWYAIVTLVHNI